MFARPLTHVEVEMLVAQLGGWHNAAVRITPQYNPTKLRDKRGSPVLCTPSKGWALSDVLHEMRGGMVVYGVHRYFPDTRTIKTRPFTGETS